MATFISVDKSQNSEESRVFYLWKALSLTSNSTYCRLSSVKGKAHLGMTGGVFGTLVLGTREKHAGGSHR